MVDESEPRTDRQDLGTLRRRLRRQGLVLSKSHVRRTAPDQPPGYTIRDAQTKLVLAEDLTLEEVELWLDE